MEAAARGQGLAAPNLSRQTAPPERTPDQGANSLIKTEGLDDVARARVSREAQAMGRLGTHPHIVTVFDLGEEMGSAKFDAGPVMNLDFGRSESDSPALKGLGNIGFSLETGGFVSFKNDPARADPLRAVPPGVEKKLHLLARRLILPHPRGGMIDVTAPLPEHMRKTFEMFGFEPPSRDPIEDAPDE